jgi:hypothetical protein
MSAALIRATLAEPPARKGMIYDPVGKVKSVVSPPRDWSGQSGCSRRCSRIGGGCRTGGAERNPIDALLIRDRGRALSSAYRYTPGCGFTRSISLRHFVLLSITLVASLARWAHAEVIFSSSCGFYRSLAVPTDLLARTIDSI